MSETGRAKFGDRSATGKNFLDLINTRWPETPAGQNLPFVRSRTGIKLFHVGMKYECWISSPLANFRVRH